MKCNMCVYYPKCKEIPVEENCCEDFKDSMMFVELPFMVNQLVFYIEPATKYEPVIIDGAAYFKLVDDSKVKCRLFDGDALEEYLKPILPFMERRVKKYFATKAEAEEMNKEKKKEKEKPIPKRCVCGSEAILVKTRSGKMYSCPNPLICRANLRTRWHKGNDQAIVEWNALVDSFYSKNLNKGGPRS